MKYDMIVIDAATSHTPFRVRSPSVLNRKDGRRRRCAAVVILTLLGHP